MSKVRRRFALPGRFDTSLETRLRAVMNSSFSSADKSNLDNALHLAGAGKLGQSITLDDIKAIAKRTTEPAVAMRILGDLYKTQDRSSVQQLLRASMGMCTIATKNAALDGTDGTMPNIVLAAFFANRILSDPEGTIRRLADLKVDPVKKIVRLFLSWWSSLDLDDIRKSLEPKSLSASCRVTFCQAPECRGKPVTEQRKFIIKRNGVECGQLDWDSKVGEPTTNGHGWLVTLFDGFAESAYRTGKNPINPNEPFTVVHAGEIKLRNPAHLTSRFAKQWAREALKL